MWGGCLKSLSVPYAKHANTTRVWGHPPQEIFECFEIESRAFSVCTK